MSKKENRFNKLAGLFDSPIINPSNLPKTDNQKPLKKWDESMSKRFEAIHLIRKEIKYFGTDFETWARDQFGSDSEQYTYAVKLSKKLAKTEALLYNILSQMTDLAKTGEINSNNIKAFDTALIKLAQDAGFEVEELQAKANCLPGCTCSTDAVCPADSKCDNCRVCQVARRNGLEAEANQDDVDQVGDTDHRDHAHACPNCGHGGNAEFKPVEADEQNQETIDMAMGEHVDINCSCNEEDDCPNSKNCRYCPHCQSEIVKAAESSFDYTMNYQINTDANGTSWSAYLSGQGYSSMEEAENDIMDLLGEAIEKMDLEEDTAANESSKDATKLEELDLNEEDKQLNQEEEEKEVESQDKTIFEPPTDVRELQAQRTMHEGSPRSSWVDVKLNISDNKMKVLEVAFEERGIFAQPIKNNEEHILRVQNAAKNINNIIDEVLKANNVSNYECFNPYHSDEQ